MRKHGDTEAAKAGQRIALLIAATGALWAFLSYVGRINDWSGRTLALIDLFALAGFGLGLWQTYKLWRARRTDEGKD